MIVLFRVTIALGVFLFAVGVVCAYASCDPTTLNTVNYRLMEFATIISILGISTTFVSAMMLHDEKLNYPRG